MKLGLELLEHGEMNVAIKLDEIGKQQQRALDALDGGRRYGLFAVHVRLRVRRQRMPQGSFLFYTNEPCGA
jgi:hypothetical protein